jgi:uncharacterized protein YecE (DUF72 family)
VGLRIPRHRRKPQGASRAPARSRVNQRIRVGIGGWDYEPWRKTFYPKRLAKNAQLAYASTQVTSIEINSTFYRLQKPASFRKWRDSTPDGFMFSVKAPRFLTQRKVLGGVGPYLKRFIDSGIAELEPKLGPLLWQLSPKQAFDADDIQRFFDLLPGQAHGVKLHHAIEVRHQSFATPHFLKIARERAITVALVDDAVYPCIAEVTGSFIYARLRRSVSREPTGYPRAAIAVWAARARAWASSSPPRDVFIYFINGAKERAPAAAMSLIEALPQLPAARGVD